MAMDGPRRHVWVTRTQQGLGCKRSESTPLASNQAASPGDGTWESSPMPYAVLNDLKRVPQKDGTTSLNPTTLVVEMCGKSCSGVTIRKFLSVWMDYDGLWPIMSYYIFWVWRSMMDSQRIHTQWYLHILSYPCEIGFSMVQWLP